MKDVAVATRCLPHSLRVRSLKTELKAGLVANFCLCAFRGTEGGSEKVSRSDDCVDWFARTRRKTAGVI